MYEQAELVSFLRTILIIILIIYAFRLLVRVVFPFLLRLFVKRAQKNFQNQFEQQFERNQTQATAKEGEVEIKIPNKPGKSNQSFDDGDYIDFEEVKE